ncbi:hypothetical protein F5884DRAFT_863484 [Xylogone sp. PMI_703]|nr:hypothetical protein F5884DRAFT_864071 [Xylogone sp. PMI_703]KAH8799321.1 hypothetical protein F5884DRAFT_863484 [Xylogone sp. PMI_703]
MSLVALDLSSFKLGTNDVNTAKRQGAFYLKISQQQKKVLDHAVECSKRLFACTSKEDIGFDSENCVGYGRNSEATDGRIDQKEMFDWETEDLDREALAEFGQRLVGVNCWPSESDVPKFRESMGEFEEVTSKISQELLTSLDLDDIIRMYSDNGQKPQYRMKLVHYPQLLNNASDQGCGAHTDHAEWITIIHEQGEHGLEVELDGKMVPVQPKTDHVLVIFGQPLENVTRGRIQAGRHRVILSEHGDRYSAIFFMTCPRHLSEADVQARLEGLPSSITVRKYAQVIEELIKGRRHDRKSLP